jgi:GMP reductase
MNIASSGVSHAYRNRRQARSKPTFKDVLIRPKRSTLNTRSAVDVDRAFRFLHTGSEWKGFPLIAANMDVTGTMAMAHTLGKHGALTALHKHYPEPKLASSSPGEDGAHAFYSLGTTAADVKKLASVAKAAPIRFICLDVANGYAEKFLETVKRVRDDYPNAVVMAGNVVTGDMTEALILAGADIVKIGIGPGSVCTTRRVTGVGYPQLSAIIECADAAHGLKGQVCADGGCTAPGDVAKAYGAGADFVMLGGMLAGHDECDGEIRYEERGGEKVAVGMTFYGMSSETAMKKHSGGVAHYRAAEGKTVETPYRGSVENTMAEIMGGVRSMMTYIGAAQLKEVSKRTTFVRVTAQTNDERASTLQGDSNFVQLRSQVRAVAPSAEASARQARSPSERPSLRVAARSKPVSRAWVRSNGTTERGSTNRSIFASSTPASTSLPTTSE